MFVSRSGDAVASWCSVQMDVIVFRRREKGDVEPFSASICARFNRCDIHTRTVCTDD